MLRRIVTGVAFALVMLGGAASAAGMAQADSRAAEGSMVFVKWYKGANSMHSLVQCMNDAENGYPGRHYKCKPADTGDDMLWLWVEY